MSSKRESMASDNSGDLPEAMDIDGMPTSFEPGMFKNNDVQKSRTKEENSEKVDDIGTDRNAVEIPEPSKDKEVRVKEEGEEISSSTHKKHHHHHSSKVC